jgi:hypothetical protein
MNTYDISVPVFLSGFRNLLRWLDKAELFSSASATNLISARLAPDMFNLIGQVQVASDMAKFCGARLSGVEAPAFSDDEETMSELRSRIHKTIKFLESLKVEQFEGNAGGTVVVVLKQGVLTFSPLAYLTQFALPNFYFHMTTAYNILRHHGVPLGKMDYLGILES